jgi:glycosyltransferase involved in cell wall biosynthesis
MTVGTPVLASNVTAIPKVVGDAALLVDPFEVDAMAAGLARLGTDDALRTTLRERGFKRAAVYNPRAVGERAFAAFKPALAMPGSAATTNSDH